MSNNAFKCAICEQSPNLSLALSSFRGVSCIDSWHYCTIPTSQVGPSCGIAALASAFSALSIEHKPTFDSLLHLAKEKGWTTAGEMFYAENVAKLAATASIEIDAEVFNLCDNFLDARAELLFRLMKSPILLAYDCDADFHPKQCSGQKAHWAVLTGFCTPSASHETSSNSTQVRNLASKEAEHICHICKDLVEDAVYFWTLQGKSRLFRTFKARDLLLSNFQLAKADSSLADLGYIVPRDCDITETLSKVAVAISSK